MKLRIRGNTLRLRLGQSEVEAFGRTGKLYDSTSFSGGGVLHWGLESSVSEKTIRADFQSNELRIFIPKSQADYWASGQEVSLRSEGSGDILVEKDFKCLDARPDEDESDSFPNPKA